jgi:hypothetical protein
MERISGVHVPLYADLILAAGLHVGYQLLQFGDG